MTFAWKWNRILGQSLLLGAAAGAVGACSSDDDESMPAEDDLVSLSLPDKVPSVLLKEPGLMARLEAKFPLTRFVGGSGKAGSEMFASSKRYQSMQQTVASDTGSVDASDPAAGVGLAYSHRLFDANWLKSPNTRFELVGITNRLDLRHQALGKCGEVHFIYRLAYTTNENDPSKRVDSRLPFTINVLVPQGDDGTGCKATANAWIAAAGKEAGLLAGPLKNVAAAARVEINYQLVRWPSTVRPDMGGHAEYELRAFRVDADKLTSIPLEDTPRISLSASEKAELRTWIKNNVAAIDEGTARIPEKFLDTSVRSVSPRGAAREANHRFETLFGDDKFADLSLSSTKNLQSPGALLHRLDGMTCNGCHQSRGIAGFQLLGEERSGTQRLNALLVGASPHLLESAKWRDQFVRAIATGQTPPKRPHADHVAGATGGYGSHCSLGTDPGFSSFGCNAGLTCKKVDGTVQGFCMPAGKPTYGDAVEESTVTQTENPRSDRVNIKKVACVSGKFAESGDGFPNGMCHDKCETIGKLPSSGHICAGLPFGENPTMRALGGFNKCLASKPFRYCLMNDQTPTVVRTCDADNPCRDDYVCARVFVAPQTEGSEPVEPNPYKGACMPPYFIFQGRVDGHKL